jgi:putative membrane protein
MANQPYARFSAEEMILRDYLAADRNSLANERTLLSYIRTALALVVSGVSAIHFLNGTTPYAVGVTLIAGGVLTFVIGSWRFLWHRRRINGITRKGARPPQPD